jgi:hypothetical protein
VSVTGTPVEAKLCTFSLESTHFIFNLCPIYTHDGASAKFSTNSQETDYSVGEEPIDLKCMNLFHILTRETYKTINEVKAAFKKFDKNSDGSLSKNELARMMYR